MNAPIHASICVYRGIQYNNRNHLRIEKRYYVTGSRVTELMQASFIAGKKGVSGTRIFTRASCDTRIFHEENR